MADKRSQLADDFLRRFASALRSAQLYSAGHPIIARNIEALGAGVEILLSSQSTIAMGIVGTEIVVGEVPVGKVDALGDLVRRMQLAGIERVVIERGISRDEVAELVYTLASIEMRRAAEDPIPELPAFPHIRLGRTQIEQRVEGNLADTATIKSFEDALSVATSIWESAATEGKPDVTMARVLIDILAQAVAGTRTLPSGKSNSIFGGPVRSRPGGFNHMVNVSIWTMAQARGLGIDGPLLREFGFAALMHDIGKVRTPIDVLNKPDKLTDAEFAIMKRHPVDGAEILRQTPDIPSLAPIVAFEHHLRLDGSGYPERVTRSSLNLGTMLVSIADVYDKMRAKSIPTDRILLVLGHKQHFDQHLVRRFVQLSGIYPVGSLVKLNTGEIAVVVKVYAPDPYRPQVRVMFDHSGKRLAHVYDVNLWEAADDEGQSYILRPLDPASYQLDPLTFI